MIWIWLTSSASSFTAPISIPHYSFPTVHIIWFPQNYSFASVLSQRLFLFLDCSILSSLVWLSLTHHYDLHLINLFWTSLLSYCFVINHST